MVKRVLFSIGLFIFVSTAGFGIAYAVNPEELQGAAARLTQVFVTNWPENQNVTVNNTSPIPVSFASSAPETKSITLWENQLVQRPFGPYYTDFVDVDGYKSVSIVVKRVGEPIGYRAQFSIDGTYGQNAGDGWQCSDLECYVHPVQVMGPKMRVYVEPFNLSNNTNVWISLYLTK